MQFGLYVFGREVETDGGALGVTLTYLVTALGEIHHAPLFAPISRQMPSVRLPADAQLQQAIVF